MATFNLDPLSATILGGILVLVGVALAFWGRTIVASVMTFLGALLGAAVGYIAGFTISGGFLPFILATVGAIVGAVFFGKLVKIGLAFVVGLLGAALVYIALAGAAQFRSGALDTPLIAAILVLIVVFSLTYYFVEELLGVITALVGGLLLAGGAYILLGPGQGLVALLAGLGVLVAGGVLQTIAIRRQKAAASTSTVLYPDPPPPPPY